MNRKIFIIQIFLLMAMVLLGYLVATARYVEPERNVSASLQITESDGEEEQKPAQAPQSFAPSDRCPNLGKSPIFDTIIPKPTQSPTPIPPPPQPPDIGNVTKQWKICSILDSRATFLNSATKKEWSMTVGETYNEKFRNEPCTIKLEMVDMNKFEVVISFGKQKRTLSMW